ncbi:MAG: class I SAM-dependent methyltransferase [Deltaproteobacteria bacterium]|nr:class I SAM-dependent methyltransferase [Deltaproteobacteria bacterium]
MSQAPRRQSWAGGARKRPCRYDPAPASALLTLALRAHRRGEWPEALALYVRALEDPPVSLDAALNLGSLAAHLGHRALAQRALALALPLALADARALRDLAIAHATLGELGTARALLSHCVALPDAPEGARLALIRVCLALGDSALAIPHSREAVARNPDSVDAWLALHRAVFDDRALSPAIESAARALALAPEDPRVQRCLAHATALQFHAPRDLSDQDDALQFCIQNREIHTRAFASKHHAIAHARDARVLDGPIVELGVRHGVSTRVLAQAQGAQVHAFDSFEGLPAAWNSLPLGAFTTRGHLPSVPPNVTLYVGWFEQTLPTYCAHEESSPSMIHVDSDVYESARCALSHLGPRVRPGCVLLFDEYLGNAGWRDEEHRALTEAIVRFHWSITWLSLSWLTGQAALRVTAVGDT